MFEKVIKEIWNYIGTFVDSCKTNFTRAWREYMRVMALIDLTKPLKRRIKMRKAGANWFQITFTYENVPTFCFICDLLGHYD